MKKCMIYVLLSLIGVPTIQAQMLTYEEIVKEITVHLPEMNIKDSVFLQEIDSKIFNSGCACLDYEGADVFNVKSKRQDDGSYYLIFSISSSPGARDGTGYFEYNDFLFVWHGDLPPYLYERTGKKRRFTYQQYVPTIICDWGDFYFKYSRGKMEITGLGCW